VTLTGRDKKARMQNLVDQTCELQNDCATRECCTILLTESSSGNIPSYSRWTKNN